MNPYISNELAYARLSGHGSYEDLAQDLLISARDGLTPMRNDRTGVGTYAVFGARLGFDLARSVLPLMTSKRVPFKSMAAELLWFLSGSTDVSELQALGSAIWDEWKKEDGTIGPMYGKQWRSWSGADGQTHDQISAVMESLKNDPYGRRHIVSAWNVGDLKNMALSPCHALFQFFVREYEDTVTGEKVQYLDCQLYQRSADVFLGVPFNIASYSLLTHMMAQQLGYRAGRFYWVGGDTHLYSNHIEPAQQMLDNWNSDNTRLFPQIAFNRKPESIFDYRMDDFSLLHYNPHPAIKAPVAV